jgi:ketohexokinase
VGKIFGIGNATLDIVMTVDGYPRENDEIRCRDRSLRRGGNAANTLVVLSQLGHRCVWAGTLADTAEGEFIRDDLERHGVDTAACRFSASGGAPVSCILLSAETGSRTIVHYRDLPEFSFHDFRSLALESFNWLHFEGRNVQALRNMMAWARERYPSIPRSLEIEKPRPGIEALFGMAQVLLFSQGYAKERGHTKPEGLLGALHHEFPRADLFCTWGGEGAASLDRAGRWTVQPAHAPSRVIDTLGAGDTFNAAVIDGYLAGRGVGTILREACLLAGEKCARIGFDGLVRKGSQRL